MSLKTFNRVSAISILVSLALIAASIVGYVLASNKSLELSEKESKFILAVSSIRNTSDFLSEEVRKYVETQNKQYYDNYWNEVNVDNKRTRTSVVNEMLNIGLSDQEANILNKIQETSENMFPVEKDAFNFVSESKVDRARALLYSKEYLGLKDTLDHSINEFQDTLNERTEKDKKAQDTLAKTLQIISYIIIAMVALVQLIFMIYFKGKIVDPINKVTAAIKDLGNGIIDKPLTMKEDNTEIGQLFTSYKSVLNNISVLINGFERIRHSIVVGKVTDRGRTNILKGCFNDIIFGLNHIIDSLVFYMDLIDIPIMLVNKEFKVLFMNKQALEISGKTIDEVLGTYCYQYFNTNHCRTSDCALDCCFKSGKSCTAETIANMSSRTLDIKYTGIPIRDETGEIVCAMEFVTDLTELNIARRVSEKQHNYQTLEIDRLIVQLEQFSKGTLSLDLELDSPDEDTQSIYDNFSRIYYSLTESTNSIKTYISDISEVITRLMNKDLTVNIESEYLGDFIALKASINKLAGGLNSVFTDIDSASSIVQSGAEQLAETSQNMALGASNQTDAISQINDSVNNVFEQVNRNTENADVAIRLSGNIKNEAEQGSKMLGDMVSAINDIKVASENIAGIIKVIDDISFQTNLLALNAAVEAARAGEHGKGFAVVADEVRMLSLRSANAAKETTNMIDDTLIKVGFGVKTANDTVDAFSKIVSSIKTITTTVDNIAEDTISQKSSIDEIVEKIKDIYEIAQVNTASAEETASLSQEMSGQATALKSMTSEFKLKQKL